MNTLPRIVAATAAVMLTIPAGAAFAQETQAPVSAEPSSSAEPIPTASPTATPEPASAPSVVKPEAGLSISSTTANPVGVSIDGGPKRPTVLDYSQRAGARESVPASTSWAAKDESVTSQSASDVVADAEMPAREVAAVENVGGKPVITVTKVSSNAEAASVIAKDQKDPSTVAVAVPTPVSIDGQYEPDPVAAYKWQRTSSSDPSRSVQDTNRDFSPTSVFAGAAATTNVEYAWAKGRGQGVIVAVIDTGVDGKHEDLAGQVLPGFDFTHDAGYQNFTPGWQADHPHGTHVAGIISAKDNNGIGITGISPDVKILPIKVLDSNGSGSSATVAQGVVAAVDAGAHIINMSLGSPEPDPVLQTAIEYAVSKGVVIVAAGGNLGMPGYITLNGWSYPAAYPGVIGVAASWSDCGGIGGDHIDIAAPGCAILSTVPGNAYARYSGTSMATPQVAGEAALLMSAGVAPANVENVMKNATGLPTWIIKWACVEDATSTPTNRSYTCTPDGVDWDSTKKMLGAGMIQPLDAVNQVSALANGSYWPNLNEGRVVAARPVSTAPADVLAPKPVAAPTLPAAPGNFTVLGEHNTQLTLGWDAVTNMAAYTVEVTNADTGAKAGSLYVNHEMHYAIVTGLTNGTAYKVRVMATLMGGALTQWSSYLTATPKATPMVPTAVTVSAVNGSGAKITMRMPATPTPATAVQLTYTEKATGKVAFTKDLAAGTLTDVVDTLTRGTEYVASFRVANSAGWSRWSSPMPFTPAGVGKITGVTSSAGNLSTSLNWNVDSQAASYRVRVSVVSAPAGVNASRGSVAFNGASAKITRLTPGATYDISIAGYDTKVGPYSTPVRVSAARTNGPSSVNVSAGGGYVSAAWSAVPGASTYTVSVLNAAGTRISGYTTANLAGTSKTGVVGTAYRVKVEALVDGSVTESSYSPSVTMSATR